MITTRYCPECARLIDVVDSGRLNRTCRYCGTSLPQEDDSRWINVARVTNLAEAGFLADELAAEGIEARIYQSGEFSAVTDRWSANYLIQTSPHEAPAAAERIRRHLAEMESQYQPSGGREWDDDAPAIDPALWRPMILVVLAGMASFVLGQKVAEQRDTPRPPRSSLAGAVSVIGRPLVTEPAPGLPRHRLYYHQRDRAWYLDTDAESDGHYESRRRFSVTGSDW